MAAMKMPPSLLTAALLLGTLAVSDTALAEQVAGAEDSHEQDVEERAERRDTRPSVAPDIRDEEIPLKVERGDTVAVPIPISNPTLDTGLVGAAAYFYPQTEEEAELQPASLTGVAGMWTSNDSKALALVQQNYWNRNNWRFTGAIGAADIRLNLIPPDEEGGDRGLDWRVQGGFLFARLSRRIAGHWYGGGLLRVVDTEQTIEDPVQSRGFDTGLEVRAAGLGLTLEYDNRDMPTNAHTGRYAKVEALFNDETIGSSQTYQDYTATFKSYHKLSEPLVLAWEVRGCRKNGNVPLWDACRIPLRGFAAFDYLGSTSTAGQVEARWKVYKRFGLVAFGGGGWVGESFSTAGDDERVSSYGAGIRFEVLPAKRINVRVDYARSDEADAIYLSVGEAF
jgi:hypothetical protein